MTHYKEAQDLARSLPWEELTSLGGAVCPNCGYQFFKNNPSAVHFDCPSCGWVDNSV